MDNACALMSERITELVKVHKGLARYPVSGEYAGRGRLDEIDTGKLTQRELVDLFELCIRYDMVELYHSSRGRGGR